MSLIRHLKSACAKDLRQDGVCVLKEQGSQEGWSRVNEGRAEADKVMETTDQILQGLKYSNSNVNEIAGIQSGW